MPYGRCFVSHSYDDAPAVQKLRELLSGSAQLEVFPPIRVPPESMVSNELLPAIRSCDTLVFVSGGRSDESGWVALERDYARRSGLEVYSFDPLSDRLVRDESKPLNLPVFASYSREDRGTVSDIVDFMSRERYFDIFLDTDISAASNIVDTLRRAIHSRLDSGGYLTLFWTRKASESPWVEHEFGEVLKKYSDRVMPALLEEAPLPAPLSHLNPVRLYQADGSGLDRRRLDDLIVRLYWLIRRNRDKTQGDA